MLTSTLRTRLLATTMIALAGPAFAQTAAPASTGDENELIVVTGSRIAQPELTSATPLTVVGSEDIKLTGNNRIEDLLNSLPQVFAGQGGNLSNGASGIATVNLRGLGSSRTLVLINGRRLGPGDPRTPVADLNFIPSALVQKIDVTTGGASSVYGSDAVAGVVNFVMDTNFEGVKLDAQYSFFQHDNNGDDRVRRAVNARGYPLPDGNTVGGDAYQLDLAIGLKSPDGRGHATVYAGYRSLNALTQAERDFSACTVTANQPTAAVPTDYTCGGSGTSFPARFLTNGAAPFTRTNADGTTTTIPSITRVIDRVTGALRPTQSTDAFNFAPYNYFQRPDERFTLGGFAEYEVASFFRPYLEVMFMDDQTNAVIAPSGVFNELVNVACNNPLLTADQVATLCTRYGLSGAQTAPTIIARRNLEGGGRDNALNHNAFRIVIGSKGDIGGGFSYDVYGQYQKTRLQQIYFNDFSITRTNRALDVIANPALADGGVPGIGLGTPVCRSVFDGTDPNCVPYNIFRLGGVTPQALAYLQVPLFQTGESTEQIVSGSITGRLGEYGLTSPFAENGVGIAVGGEYRDEFLRTDVDVSFDTGDGAGQGGPTKAVKGGFNVAEAFAEISVPLIEKRPFFDLLRIEAGYRYSDYNTSGSTDTYKVAGIWKPVRDIQISGGYNRAVRAPNAVELFSPQSIGLFNGADPCAGPLDSGGTTVNGNTLAQCARTGVTAATFGNILANIADQYNQFSGGNPNLLPEVSDTYTIGVTLTPRFLPGFSLRVDGFDIKIDNLISTVGAQLILDQCLSTGNSQLCGLIQRSPGNGSLYLGQTGFVTNTNVNIGGLKTRGIDVLAAYKFDFEDVGIGLGGGLGFDFVGTYLDQLITRPGSVSDDGNTQYECKGYYGLNCGTPNPEWRHQLRVTYSAPGGFQASVRWRHFGGVRQETASANDFLSGTVRPADARLPAQNYFDLAFRANVTDRHSFRIGVNNVADKDPPVVGGPNLTGTFGSGNTFPNVYDALGRYIYAGFTSNF